MEITISLDMVVVAAGLLGAFLALLLIGGLIAKLIEPYVVDIIRFFERMPAVREEDRYQRGGRR